VHVGGRGLAGGADWAIWRHAQDHGLVIVTKDEDFQRLSVLHGAPPKVIWIRLGNCSTADIVRLLTERRDAIDRLSQTKTPRSLGSREDYVAAKKVW
jgi:predicted nuclease of predicted toxin-antitoxin system